MSNQLLQNNSIFVVSLSLYYKSQTWDLNEIGILGNHMNLTTETLFIRLAFVLSNLNKSNNLKDKSIYDINFNKLWNSNLEGF